MFRSLHVYSCAFATVSMSWSRSTVASVESVATDEGGAALSQDALPMHIKNVDKEQKQVGRADPNPTVQQP